MDGTRDVENAVEIAAAAARAGGQVVRDADRTATKVDGKGYADVTTSTDRAAHLAIVDVISHANPQHAVVGEDGTHGDPASPWVWYVDALDGTVNYVAGIRIYCVSVALRRGGTAVAAAVYDPTRDELYTAGAGRGAYLNGERLRVHTATDLTRAVVATQHKPTTAAELDRHLAEMRTLTEACLGVRVPGSRVLALCDVAAGRLAGYCEHGIDPWDLAAGELLVTEAGGQVTDFRGAPTTLTAPIDVVASNGELHERLLHLLEA